MLPISSANALINRNVIIWGSRSSGAYISNPGDPTWRKTSAEISEQTRLAASIASMFSSYGGYMSTQNYQGANSVKAQILGHITYTQNNYPFTAVIDFDHGVGNYYPNGAFHYMFEDDVGTLTGGYSGTPVPANGVYDYEIFANTGGNSQQSKINFAYISTCMSSDINTNGTIQTDNRQVGMPYAWTHREPYWMGNSAFNTQSHMSLFGYSQPDSGSYCYIGFSRGSPALAQIGIQNGYPVSYSYFVDAFFAAALMYRISIHDALDRAALMCFGQNFGQTQLYTGFISAWPTYNGSGWFNMLGGPNPDTMTVYGNSNMYLY
jgi:hypothetical protein